MLLRRSHLKKSSVKDSVSSVSKSKDGSINTFLRDLPHIPSNPPIAAYFNIEQKKKYICQVVNQYFEHTNQKDRPATQHIKARLHRSMHQCVTSGDWSKKNTSTIEMTASIAVSTNPQNSKVFSRSSKRKLLQTTQHFDFIQNPLQSQKIFHSRQLLKKQLHLIRQCGFPSPYKQQQGNILIYRHNIPSLKDELYTLVKSGCEEYLMIPTAKYYNLFANGNESLKTLIIELCLGLKEGCASNGIRLNNIYQAGEKQFILKDYSTGGYIQRIPLSGREPLQIEHPSIITEQNMLYLAPQLQSQCTPPPSVASQIWSIGCLLLQLVTFVPLWVGKMKIKGDPVRRRGLLAQINLPPLHKLKIIVGKLDRILRKKVIIADTIIEVDEKVIKVVKGMLRIHPNHRMTVQDVISTLQG